MSEQYKFRPRTNIQKVFSCHDKDICEEIARARADERAKILKILKEEHYKFGYKSLADAIEIIEKIGAKE